MAGYLWHAQISRLDGKPSMHPSRSALRGRLAAASALVLACGVSVLLPAPAQASSMLGQAGISVGSDSAGGTCTGTASDTRSFSFSTNATKSASRSLSGTVTDSGDAGDVTTWSTSGQMSLTSRTGDAPSFTTSGKVAAAVDAQQNDASDCNVTAQASAQAVGLLDLDSSGWINVSLDHPAGTLGYVIVINAATLQVIHQGLDSESYDASVWVNAGSYQVQMAVIAQVDDDSATTTPRTGGGSFSGSATYALPGAATGAAAGSGKAFLNLGKGVNCSDRQVVGIFTRKASALRSATFSVNGKKQRSVTTPSAGQAVVLKAGSATSSTTVKVVMRTKRNKTVSVSRSYLACK